MQLLRHLVSILILPTSVVVLMPMVAPLIGGILDTLFGWEAIFVFAAGVSFTVFVWAALALPTLSCSVATRSIPWAFPTRSAMC